ncbi:MAG: transglycosylase SLT domain-containing protein [Pseudothermotoga sp.]
MLAEKTKKILVMAMLLATSSLLLAETAPSWFSKLVRETRLEHDLIVDTQIIDEMYSAIVEVSKKHDFDPLLIIALIKVESEFRNVVGMYGELGLVQIKKETAEFVAQKYSLSEPEGGWLTLLWDYRLNIEYGVLYLKYLLQKTSGNLLKALEMYNGGNMKSEYANRIVKEYKELMVYKDTNSGR